jgi:hypothetical protein
LRLFRDSIDFEKVIEISNWDRLTKGEIKYVKDDDPFAIAGGLPMRQPCSPKPGSEAMQVHARGAAGKMAFSGGAAQFAVRAECDDST